MLQDLLDNLRKAFSDLTTEGPGLAVLISLGLAAGLYLFVRYLILGILLRRVDPEKHKWLHLIIDARIPHLLTLLVPPVVIWTVLPYYSPESYNIAISILSRFLAVYVAFVITLVLNAGLSAIDDYYSSLEYSRNFPISSILEVARVVLFVLSAAIVISILFNIRAVYILTAIGALIAAATVVFNNLILAFVAGLIVTSKKLIVIGDWIEIPELRINGEVLEITPTTVIVRNLDHTIGTVPSAYLLANSFKNWRGVLQAGARQMAWPVYFDINSVKPAGLELLEEISRLPYGAEILRSKAVVEAHGNPDRIPPGRISPGRSSGATNLALFREYCSLYLQNHPLIAPQKLLSVYLDAPTQFGIPMRVLVSTHETDYKRFLEIQSDVLEEILRLANVFGLKVYQHLERFDPIQNSADEQ